jgi:hypothetical protein
MQSFPSRSGRSATSKRWFQFRVGTLLLAVTAVAIWFGILKNRVDRRRRAIEQITELGGTIQYDYEREAARRNRPAEPPGPRWLRKLIGDELFVTVAAISLDDLTLSDADLEQLSIFTRAKYLGLRNTQVSDAGFKHLRGWTQLEFLQLSGTQIGDEGLAHLDRCGRLEYLYLNRTLIPTPA